MTAQADALPAMGGRVPTERWLSQRGLPQLVEGYGTERSIDIRTMRWVLLWIAFQVVLLCWTAPVGLEIRVAGIAAGIVGLIGYVALYAQATGRNLWRPHDSLRSYDVLATGIVPAIVAGVRFGSPGAAVEGFLFHLQGVAIIYLFIGFGLAWILLWSVGWLASQAPQVMALAARTLPLVLILVIFLLFASELWQAAAFASVAELVAVIVIATVIGLGLLATRVGDDVRSLEASDPRDADLRGTPAESTSPATMPAGQPALSRLQRWNVGLVLLISQSIQATVVSVIVVIFLLLVGMLLAPVEVQSLWAGRPVTELVAFHAFDERRVLSAELLAVTTLLGTFAGVYFAGFALDDDRYRAGAVARTLADLRVALAVRAAYVGAERSGPAGPLAATGRG